MQNIVIFPIIFFFLNTTEFKSSNSFLINDNNYEIYLTKQYWHTAIVILSEDIDGSKYRFKKYFEDYKLIDFGWGDELFYQIPDFDLYLAARAILKPTSSTLRIEGINLAKEILFQHSDITVRMFVSKIQLEKILDFIENTFYKNSDQYILLNSIADKIFYFKAKGEYHLFNTCNTWLAKCLRQAGIDIETNIILTEQLFREAIKHGEVIVVNR